jgi:uncharacterized membrane protein YoaK (UPF0700 family)
MAECVTSLARGGVSGKTGRVSTPVPPSGAAGGEDVVGGGPAPAAAPAAGGRRLALALLTLTFTTGLVDAATYLGLGQVFTGFQTGNVVLLGFAFAGTEGFSVAASSASLGSFFVGAAVGGRLAGRLSARHRGWFGMSLAMEALLMALAAAVAVGLSPAALTDRRFAVIALLGLAMGLRNASVRRLAVADLTTTVLTSTVTGLAAEARLVRSDRARQARRVAAIGAMLLGAVAGALLVRVSLVLPFVVVAGIIALTGAVYRTTVR